MLTITIKEEVFGTGNINELPIHFSSERLTLADLIQIKVAAKIKQVNANLKLGKIETRFLSKEEKILNSEAYQKRLKVEKNKIEEAILDMEKSYYEALAGFQQNAFFVIVDGKQRENLEEELVLTEDSTVRFIQLVPLVGG